MTERLQTQLNLIPKVRAYPSTRGGGDISTKTKLLKMEDADGGNLLTYAEDTDQEEILEFLKPLYEALGTK